MITELANEDGLRLAVLMAGDVHAVRIDEGAMVLYALTPKGEAKVALNPNCRREAYLTHVREVLGGHALGSPGGYPVHLRHWTRMGHASPKNLEALLKLGEPEAVAAVAYAPGLTDELARRAWWALPTVEIAQVMLAHPEVRSAGIGRELAAFLIEHLPFESDPTAAMNIVRSVLAADLIDRETRLSLWQKGRRRPYYLVGFLESCADALPEDGQALEVADDIGDGRWARQWRRCCSAQGQAWLKAMELALDKAPAHEAVYLLLDLIGQYFEPVREQSGREHLSAREAAAMAALAEVSGNDAEATLVRTTAVGPQLRKILDPLVAPVLAHLRTLQGKPT